MEPSLGKGLDIEHRILEDLENGLVSGSTLHQLFTKSKII